MPVLVAPDKFKGSLTAVEVAAHLTSGLLSADPGAAVRQLPVADGGDGTVAAAVAAGFTEQPATAHGPTGRPVSTRYARRDDTAVVELAAVCGLQQLPAGRLEPLAASSAGLGEVILHAVRAGCTRVVIGLGGSASTDGGAGLLTALGATVADGHGRPVAPGGGGLAHATTLDLTGLDPAVSATEFLVASDVTNPLLGTQGAAYVFAPQKGADLARVHQLEDAMARWTDVVAAAAGPQARHLASMPGAGAAGGVGFAAMAVLGARTQAGIDVVLDLLDFDRQLSGCDLVVTGEGRLDEQTLHGKAPAGVARAARRAGIPVVAVVGSCDLPPDTWTAAGLHRVYRLSDLEPSLARSIADAPALLRRIGAAIAADHRTAAGDPAQIPPRAP